jgi:hypothetical protein
MSLLSPMLTNAIQFEPEQGLATRLTGQAKHVGIGS